MGQDQGYEVIDADAAARAMGVDEMAYTVLVGLSSKPKHLPSRYFYDDRGSELFTKIMAAPEYYLTNCEHEILEEHAETLASTLPEPFDVVDLGAGDGAKTMHLLRALDARNADFTYVPVDISEGAMQGLVARVRDALPKVRVRGLVSEYTEALRWLADHDKSQSERARLVLFLGSNIGNFNRVQARGFLSRIWTHLDPRDRMLVGFDLKKDIEVLLRAYNDSGGVTAAFNLNLLARLNHDLDAEFDLKAFRHYGTYEVRSGAMESYLVSLKNQSVHVGLLQKSFEFRSWEPIHVEYSYKYLPSDVDSLAQDSGYEVVKRFTDKRRFFADDLWRPVKSPRRD